MAVVWLAGLAAGFFALLSAAAQYGCGANDHGLACRSSGSALGVVLVLAVIAVVTTVTVTTFDRPTRPVIVIGALGVLALAVCFVLARMLIGTA